MKKQLLTFSSCALLLACASTPEQPKAASAAPIISAPKTSVSTSSWDNSYGGVDKSYDTTLLKMRSEMVSKFQQLTYQDRVTGRSMAYNLYIPKGYTPGKHYPLIMFIADASTVSKGVKSPLMQGYGGFIWATEASQAKHPAFVLVPAFAGPQSGTNDNWQVSDEVGMANRLLKDTIARYQIDRDRVFATGQSMGGMISFYLNATEPDLFAASMFVGSQWDTKVLSPLAHQRFLYVISAADPKASVGMKELGGLLTSLGAKYGETEFSAYLPQAEQNSLTQQLLDKGLPINFIRFSPATVAPKEYQTNPQMFEHMYSFDHAYLLEPARDWLFKQSRGK